MSVSSYMVINQFSTVYTLNQCNYISFYATAYHDVVITSYPLLHHRYMGVINHVHAQTCGDV